MKKRRKKIVYREIPRLSTETGMAFLMAGMGALVLGTTGMIAFRHLSPASRESGSGPEPAPEPFGSIVALDGSPIAASVTDDELKLNPRRAPVSGTFALAMGYAGGTSPLRIAEAGLARFEEAKPKGRTWVLGEVPNGRLTPEAAHREFSNPGTEVARNIRRVYPSGPGLAGLVGSDRQEKKLVPAEFGAPGTVTNPGANRSEAWFAEFLATGSLDRGRFGRAVEVDAMDATARARILAESRREGGDRTVKLTIQPDLQRKAQQLLDLHAERLGALEGVVLVMETKTGRIAAAANYEPKDGEAGRSQGDARYSGPFLPITALYAPGSLMKLWTLAAAVSEEKVTGTEIFHPRLLMKPEGMSGKAISNRRNIPLGPVNAEGAIAISCNTTAAEWALRVGQDAYMRRLKSTGLFDRPLQLGVPSTPRAQYAINGMRDFAVISFGQSVSFTPVGVLALLNTVGNGGDYVEPRLVEQMSGVPLSSRVRKGILSQSGVRMAMRGARAVFDSPSGTAHRLQVAGFPLAGKSGTAQIHEPDREKRRQIQARLGQKPNAPHQYLLANFVGYYPAEQPRYTVLAMVRFYHQEEGIGGSMVAGPIYRDLALYLRSREGGATIEAATADAQHHPLPVARPIPLPRSDSDPATDILAPEPEGNTVQPRP